jgi:hypothetical protein
MMPLFIVFVARIRSGPTTYLILSVLCGYLWLDVGLQDSRYKQRLDAI